MTDTSGPQHDEPRDPQQAVPMWVEPVQAGAAGPVPAATPGATYPPGFEPGAPEAGSADGGLGSTEQAAVGSADSKPRSGRRPVVAGVVGGVLIALLGFGGGYAVGTVTGGHDGDQLSTQGVSRLSPPIGEGRGDGDGDGGPGQRLVPGGGLPDTGGQESGTDT